MLNLEGIKTFNWNKTKLRNLRDIYGNIEEVSRLGALRIWILQVLDNGPKNGVEIMDAIHELQEQFFHMRGKLRRQSLEMFNRGPITPRRPLPGSIYPMLKKMVNEELIIKQEDGRYKLTEQGQKIIHEIIGTPSTHYHAETAIENAIKEIDSYSSYLEDIKPEKLLLYRKQIIILSERLRKIEKSLKK